MQIVPASFAVILMRDREDRFWIQLLPRAADDQLIGGIGPFEATIQVSDRHP